MYLHKAINTPNIREFKKLMIIKQTKRQDEVPIGTPVFPLVC